MLALRILGVSGVCAGERALRCRVQLGSQSWLSAPARSGDDDQLWDVSTTLVVDDQANQQAIVTLQEQHTFGSVQTTQECRIDVRELVARSRRRYVPRWELPGAAGSP